MQDHRFPIFCRYTVVFSRSLATPKFGGEQQWAMINHRGVAIANGSFPVGTLNMELVDFGLTVYRVFTKTKLGFARVGGSNVGKYSLGFAIYKGEVTELDGQMFATTCCNVLVYQIMTLFGRKAQGLWSFRVTQFGIAPNVQSTAGIFQFGCCLMGWCRLFVCRQPPMLKALFQSISTCSQICVNGFQAVSGKHGLNTGRVGSEGSFLRFPPFIEFQQIMYCH